MNDEGGCAFVLASSSQSKQQHTMMNVAAN